MSERLDEYPEALLGEEPYPWEDSYRPVALVPFPNLRSFGKPLQSLTSLQLNAVIREAERRNGAGHYFDPVIDQAEAILRERQGE